MKHTIAEAWMDLERHLKALWLAILHSLGLHTRAELETRERWARAATRRAEQARASQRETERLLVLLSEPLKDWDLADFPEPHYLRTTAGRYPLGGGHANHLANVLEAYRLTAPAVAPLRLARVVDDKVKCRGWDDEPLHAPCHSTLDPKRLP